MEAFFGVTEPTIAYGAVLTLKRIPISYTLNPTYERSGGSGGAGLHSGFVEKGGWGMRASKDFTIKGSKGLTNE